MEHLMRIGLTEDEAFNWIHKELYFGDDFADEMEGLLEEVKEPTFTSS